MTQIAIPRTKNERLPIPKPPILAFFGAGLLISRFIPANFLVRAGGDVEGECSQKHIAGAFYV